MDRCDECHRLVRGRGTLCDDCAGRADTDGGSDTGGSTARRSGRGGSVRERRRRQRGGLVRGLRSAVSAVAGAVSGTASRLGGLGPAIADDASAFGTALRFPATGGLRRFLGVAFLLLVSVLVLPGVVLVGYLLRVVEDAHGGETELTPLAEFGALLREGVVAVLVALPYHVVLFGLLGAAGQAGAGGSATVRVPVVSAGTLVFTVAGAAAALGSVVLLYLLPALTVAWAATRSVGGTYGSSLPYRFAFSGRYLRTWVVSALFWALVTVGAAALAPTVVGPTLVVAYGLLASAAFWGRTYARADLPWTAETERGTRQDSVASALSSGAESDSPRVGRAGSSTGNSPGSTLTDIRGIGPSYAEELADAGIESPSDLAAADADELAAETGIYYGRIEKWQERAGDL